MTNVHTSRHIDLLPGRSLAVVLANSLTLMRAGFSKGQAMAHALNAAGYRPSKHVSPVWLPVDSRRDRRL